MIVADPFVSQLPKGAALHVHPTSMVPVDWLVEQATYDPKCYLCGDIDLARDFTFQFSDGDPARRTVPAACEKPGGWRRVVDLRARYPGTDEAFDQNLVSLMFTNPFKRPTLHVTTGIICSHRCLR
jgi:adenosine deaminase CECR1